MKQNDNHQPIANHLRLPNLFKTVNLALAFLLALSASTILTIIVILSRKKRCQTGAKRLKPTNFVLSKLSSRLIEFA